MRNINKNFILVIAVLVIISTVALFSLFFNKAPNKKIIAVVNGEQIDVREFSLILSNENRVNTFSYFNTKYGAEDSEKFWTTQYGNEIPIKYAREKTLQDIVRIKTEQILMKQKGIIDDITYDNFFKLFNEENKKRKEAVENNEIIFGTKEMNEYNSYRYIISNNLIKLKEKMAEKEFKISEEQLKLRYNNIKNRLYKSPDYIKIHQIVIGKSSEKYSEKQAFERMNSAKKAINEGKNFDEIARLYNENGEVIETTYDENTRNNTLIGDYNVNNLSKNEVSGIIETSDSYIMVKCIDKETNRYHSYESVKSNVLSTYVDEEFEKLVDNMVKNSKLEVDTKVYNKILPAGF